jgi:hypothetical protein
MLKMTRTNKYGHVDRRDPEVASGDPGYECCGNCAYRFPRVCTERGVSVLREDWCTAYFRESEKLVPK